MADFQFNANEAPEPEDFTPVPDDDYLVQITGTELEDKANSQQLKTVFELMDGKHRGRKVTMWYTVECSTSQKAKDIGMRQLREICEAMGKAGFTRTEELHDIPVIAVIRKDKDKPDYNTVRKIKSRTATPESNTPAATPTEAAPTAEKKPWE